LWIAIIVIGSLIILFLVLLSLPLDVVARLEVADRLEFKAGFRWCFGLVHKDFERKKPAEETKKEKKKWWRRRPPDLRRFTGVLRNGGFLRSLRLFVIGCLRQLHFRELQAHFRVGLGDPFETGMMFAFLAPAVLALDNIPSERVQLRPSFSLDGIYGEASGQVRVFPVRLIPPLLRFVFNLSTLKALKAMAAGRWKKKK